MPTAIETIERQRDHLERRMDDLDRDMTSAIRRQRWRCQASGCGRQSLLSSVVLVQTHWYVSPHGCTGGDYWNAGERNLICPKCSVRHRMIAQDPLPANYYDLSHEKHREIDAARQILMERKYRIADFGTRMRTFDNIIDRYDDVFYEVVRGGRKTARPDGRSERHDAGEIARLYSISPQCFSTAVNV